MRDHFSYPLHSSIEERVLSVLTLFENASSAELAAEIAGFEGISSEEGLAECTIEVQETLKRLSHSGSIHETPALINAESRYSLLK